MFSAQSTAIGLASLYAAMRPLAPPGEPAVDVEAIAADAYRAGIETGVAEAEARLLPERAALAGATAAFEAALIIDRDTLRGPFVALVTALAEAVVIAELRVSPAVVARLVDTALAAIEGRGVTSVRVNPDDFAHIARATVADPTLPRGSVIVEGADFVVADGLALRLAALVEGLA